MNRKIVFGCGIPLILVSSLLDSWLLGAMTLGEYGFQCALEYVIFCGGFWAGETLTRLRRKE